MNGGAKAPIQIVIEPLKKEKEKEEIESIGKNNSSMVFVWH